MGRRWGLCGVQGTGEAAGIPQPVPGSPLDTPCSLREMQQAIGKVVAALLLLSWISPENFVSGVHAWV